MRYFLEMADKSSEIAGLQNFKYVLTISKVPQTKSRQCKTNQTHFGQHGIVISELLKFMG